MSEEQTPRGLVIKLCKIMGELGYVEKRGENKFKDGKTKYMYATEADLVAAVRDKLAEAHIFIFPDTISTSRDGQLTDVMMSWTFIDGDTGETYTCRIPGCGADFEDKGVYKAITGSEKYLLMKSFLIPTGDDPEKNSKEAANGVAQAKINAAKHVSISYSPDMTLFVWGPGCVFIDTVLKSAGTKNVLNQWIIERGDAADVYKALQEAGIEIKEEDYRKSRPDEFPYQASSSEGISAAKAEAVKPSPNVRPSLPGEVEGTLEDVSKPIQGKNGKFVAVVIRTAMGMEVKASVFDNPKLELVDGSVSELFSLLAEYKHEPVSVIAKVNGKYTNIVGVTRIGPHEFELTPDGPIPVRQAGSL